MIRSGAASREEIISTLLIADFQKEKNVYLPMVHDYYYGLVQTCNQTYNFFVEDFS